MEEEYDGTQEFEIHLLAPGIRAEALLGAIRPFGYITLFIAKDAPDAMVRFPSVGHGIRLKVKTTYKDEDDNWECDCGTGGQGGNYCSNCGAQIILPREGK